MAEDWPPYGTPAMVQRVLTRPEKWNFSISIPLLEASLSMDTRCDWVQYRRLEEDTTHPGPTFEP